LGCGWNTRYGFRRSKNSCKKLFTWFRKLASQNWSSTFCNSIFHLNPRLAMTFLWVKILGDFGLSSLGEEMVASEFNLPLSTLRHYFESRLRLTVAERKWIKLLLLTCQHYLWKWHEEPSLGLWMTDSFAFNGRDALKPWPYAIYNYLVPFCIVHFISIITHFCIRHILRHSPAWVFPLLIFSRMFTPSHFGMEVY